MREILFRGKLIGAGKWAVGYLDHNPVTKLSFIRTPRHTHTDIEMVFPETVGQYTGLTDKNGKKIFEGDILRVVSVDCDYDYKTSVGSKCGYHDAPYVTGDFGDGDLCPIGFAFDYWQEDNAEVEVIGNIHDTPELLGGAENAPHS